MCSYNESDNYSLLAVQGPKVDLLNSISEELDNLKYYNFEFYFLNINNVLYQPIYWRARLNYMLKITNCDL